jgi:hypothetical protein
MRSLAETPRLDLQNQVICSECMQNHIIRGVCMQHQVMMVVGMMMMMMMLPQEGIPSRMQRHLMWGRWPAAIAAARRPNPSSPRLWHVRQDTWRGPQ